MEFEELSIDHYINWSLAKSQLLELHKATIDALRVCDIALQTDEIASPTDQISAKLISMFNLTNEQVETLSGTYVDAVDTVIDCADVLHTNEINNESE
mgnify:CR=1 FL=1|tara:strand:+ start:1146 stop:1439 length:294 start_codon:yes stop_codon:yes gene_type:complete